MEQDKLIKWLVILSRWVARLLVLGAVGSIVSAPFLVNPLKDTIGFVILTVTSAILLVQHMGVQTYCAFIETKKGQSSTVQSIIATVDILLMLVFLFFSALGLDMHSTGQGSIRAINAPLLFALFNGIKLAGLLGLIFFRICILLRTLQLRKPINLGETHALSDIPVFGGRLYGLIGEHPFLLLMRILVAVTLIHVFLTFAIDAIFIGPVGTDTSTRIYNTPANRTDLTWASALPLSILVVLKPEQPVAGVVSVFTIGDLGLASPCNISEAELLNSSSSFSCPSPCYLTSNNVLHNALNNTIITINFDSLEESSTAYVYVGFDHNQEDIYSSSAPIPLDRGSHIYGYLNYKFRQVFASPSSALLGFFPTSRQFSYPDIYPILSDPSPLVNRTSNSATLRLKPLHDDIQKNWMIIADGREQTVLGGLASVGGFWTFINGLFGVLLGGSLLYNFFGTRPLNAFGLLHHFQRKELREINSFPKPLSPLTLFLNRHFMDLGTFDNKKAAPSHIVSSDSYELETRDINSAPDPLIETQPKGLYSSFMPHTFSAWPSTSLSR